MVWYGGCISVLEAEVPGGVQCPWHGGLPRAGQFWDCFVCTWIFHLASKTLEFVTLCVQLELFPQAAHAFPSPFLLLGSPRFVFYILIDFQSPLMCVLGTSGYAGNPGWCVVTGQCDLRASGEQWVSKSEWKLTGVAEGCSGESRFCSVSLWLPCVHCHWYPKKHFPGSLSRLGLGFCIWRYYTCLVDFTQCKRFKIRFHVSLSVGPWRNLDMWYLNTGFVYLCKSCPRMTP